MMTHGVGVLFLASVAGYWGLERASAHKGNLKHIGQWLGGGIIVVSLLGAIAQVWTMTAYQMKWCPMGSASSKKWACPFSPNASSLPPQSP